MPPEFISLSALAEQYDAFILDLWGVIHDGVHLYPGVKESLENLHARKKKIVFLSNAPRRAARAKATLDRLGIKPDLYDGLITSGETAYEYLKQLSLGTPSLPEFAQQIIGEPTGSPYNRLRDLGGDEQKRYYFIGPERDAELLADLPYTRVKEIKDAGFLLNAGFLEDGQPLSDWFPVIEEGLKHKVPMICINPDHEVVRLNGVRALCAGLIAEEYERRGGRVSYFGKPYPEVYARCREILKTPGDKILAIGDGLHTDIAGANNLGLASALVLGGILGHMLESISLSSAWKHCEKQGILPAYFMKDFRWKPFSPAQAHA